MNITEKLLKVQSGLKAPKNQYNKFGGYSYRSCEDILEAVKPLCAEVGAAIIVGDEIQAIGTRYYVKATAPLVWSPTSLGGLIGLLMMSCHLQP